MSGPDSMSTIIRERTRQSFMKDEELSDVTFIVGHGKVKVPGHKTILAFCSRVFQAQFYGPLSRVNNEEGQGPTTVEISDMEPKTFINFMSFLYRDELTDGSKGTAEDYLDLLYPAHKYLVPALSRLCIKELREKIQLDNVFKVNEAALLYGEDKLKKWSTEYMKWMSKKIIEMPEFLNLDPSVLSVLLESDGLAASEQRIHRAVLRWAEAKVRREGEKRSREAIRNALGDLIYLIRFPTMSAMEFRREQWFSVLWTEEITEVHEQISRKDTATQSQFGTNKRRLDCNLYLCHPRDYLLKGFPVMYASEPPCRRISFNFRTDKRIFLKGLTLSSILYPHHFKNAAHEFEIELSVQVGDLPSLRTLSLVNDAVVEPEMKRSRRRSPCPPRSCPIRAVVLDKLAEVPANCVVAICVQVSRAYIPIRNLETLVDPMEVSLRQDVQVDCFEDERTVVFKFFCSKDTEYVYRTPFIPDILFSL